MSEKPKIQRPQGTFDLYPEEMPLWRLVEETARREFERAGYREMRTPLLEYTELFQRGIGGTSDIVEKEMYTFGGEEEKSQSLRPEGTASFFRAYLEREWHKSEKFQKLYYIGPMFRHERPQAGRQRQFHQVGVEAIGAQTPFLDVETITLAVRFYHALGIRNFRTAVNSIGCPECRPGYLEKLREALRPKLGEFCNTCRTRFDRNVLRMFDCKNREDQAKLDEAPKILKSLCHDCGEHHHQVIQALDALDVPYETDAKLVRGLDYYTRTVMEFQHRDLGARNAIGGGGRYDLLSEMLGGPPLGAVGFALGVETTLLALKKEKKETGISLPSPRPDVYGVAVEDDQRFTLFRLIERLRANGISADCDHEWKSLKAQFRTANRIGSPFVLVLGPQEQEAGKIKLKEMATGEESLVDQNELTEQLKRKTCSEPTPAGN